MYSRSRSIIFLFPLELTTARANTRHTGIRHPPLVPGTGGPHRRFLPFVSFSRETSAFIHIRQASCPCSSPVRQHLCGCFRSRSVLASIVERASQHPRTPKPEAHSPAAAAARIPAAPPAPLIPPQSLPLSSPSSAREGEKTAIHLLLPLPPLLLLRRLLGPLRQRRLPPVPRPLLPPLPQPPWPPLRPPPP